ncbi:MAG TPA: hypothetical protein VL125_09545 [Pelobium sp.]|nr:hypothetical protein [Pelobium sp.]
MKRKTINDSTCAQVKGRLKVNVKRIRTDPRQKIRQLLKGFISLNEVQRQDKSDHIKP